MKFPYYVIDMRINSQYQQREYCFATKNDVFDFLESLNGYQIECIEAITKYNQKSIKNAYREFFE